MILDQLVEPAGVVVETLPGLLDNESYLMVFETGHILISEDQDHVTTIFIWSGQVK